MRELQHFFKLRQQRKQVPHQPDIGNLKDRRLRVLVDRHDRAGVLDAGQMLYGATDADGHVQLRGDDLAGLADLQFVGHVTGIDRSARAPTAAPSLSARL